MEVGRQKAETMAAHFLAARRIQGGIKEHGQLRGLQASLAHHTRRLQALSAELCGGSGGNPTLAQ